jgi:hypothetical protein
MRYGMENVERRQPVLSDMQWKGKAIDGKPKNNDFVASTSLTVASKVVCIAE